MPPRRGSGGGQSLTAGLVREPTHCSSTTPTVAVRDQRRGRVVPMIRLNHGHRWFPEWSTRPRAGAFAPMAGRGPFMTRAIGIIRLRLAGRSDHGYFPSFAAAARDARMAGNRSARSLRSTADPDDAFDATDVVLRYRPSSRSSRHHPCIQRRGSLSAGRLADIVLGGSVLWRQTRARDKGWLRGVCTARGGIHRDARNRPLRPAGRLRARRSDLSMTFVSYRGAADRTLVAGCRLGRTSSRFVRPCLHDPTLPEPRDLGMRAPLRRSSHD